MKKIINGKMYDTDTAKKIGFRSNGGSWRDFSHLEETLFRKKNGEFFLFGEGGAMTKYSVSCGQNEWSGGEKIVPMTYEEASDWAERYLDADEYTAIFGDVSEGAPAGNIKDISAEAGITNRRLAELLGIPIRTVEAWSSGDREPPEYLYRLIRIALGLEPPVKK